MRRWSMVGLGLVLLTACAGSGERTMTESKMGTMDTQTAAMMKPMLEGTLTGTQGHHAAGKVAFIAGMDGGGRLTLSDLKVDRVPDGYVYLAKGGDRMQGMNLGKLTQFMGTVSFDLPAGIRVEDYDSVVIWCEQFHVEIGRATLARKTM
jgi:hypothetical protein